ncbi:hypothetical protein G7B40_038990 [Aetokthonos hydrillicola Thurmond2011]|uniref:Uncharacterized protein n=1 Tax=Aetokthonos hydrillicola Thurmond2011 TaxID=2712845 RepID=A0AAP5IH70_9CYAN|nr:hypothetical protein [Aetokthonos hydrillicola]MBW4591200.1 hypothetical protein [Aetokthonos hydrillicola CCALA 1050]MDR9900492.1 hypothetical protein [Aetokthonos hydrillicola Thurmond2011]
MSKLWMMGDRFAAVRSTVRSISRSSRAYCYVNHINTQHTWYSHRCNGSQ